MKTTILYIGDIIDLSCSINYEEFIVNKVIHIINNDKALCNNILHDDLDIELDSWFKK